jgi:hypothetical protein
MKNYAPPQTGVTQAPVSPGSTVPIPVSPSIPATGTAGQLTASSIVLTANQNALKFGPIRLINALVEVDMFSGNGVPSFLAFTGSLYLRNDTGQLYVNTSASPSGTTWSLVAAGSGAVTSVTGDEVTIHVTPTTGAVVVSFHNPITATVSVNTGSTGTDQLEAQGPIRAVRGSGTTTTYVPPLYDSVTGGTSLKSAHMVSASQAIATTVTATITLSNDAAMTSTLCPLVQTDSSTVVPTVHVISTTQFSIKNNDPGTITFRYVVVGD